MMAPDGLIERPLRRVDDVVQREVAGELFLVPIRGHLADLQELFALNEVGTWVWARLDGTRALSELALAVSQEFEVEESDARLDVAAFLAELAEAGLALEVDARAEGQS